MRSERGCLSAWWTQTSAEVGCRDSLQPEGSQNSSLPWKGTCNIGNMELKDNGCWVVVFHYAWTYTGALCLGWSEAGDHKGRLGHHVPSVEHPQQLLWCGTLWGNECSMTLETSRGQNIFKHCVCVALTSQSNQRVAKSVIKGGTGHRTVQFVLVYLC